MATKHKSVRLGDDVRHVITARRLAKNCTESEAIRELILAGGEAFQRLGHDVAQPTGGKP